MWLKCPISEKDLYDPKAIIGIGLYHAPRFLSEREKHRMVDDEERATFEKMQKKLDKVFPFIFLFFLFFFHRNELILYFFWFEFPLILYSFFQ